MAAQLLHISNLHLNIWSILQLTISDNVSQCKYRDIFRSRHNLYKRSSQHQEYNSFLLKILILGILEEL